MESIVGELLRVAYYQGDQWRTRLVVAAVDGRKLVVEGETPIRPVPGMLVRAQGVVGSEGSLQRLKADELLLEPPPGGYQRVRYLKNLLRFLPKSSAERIATYAGDLGTTLVPGVPYQTALRVQQVWRDAMVPVHWSDRLAAGGISRSRSPQIARGALESGEDPLELLERRPHRLYFLGATWKEVEGIGHKRGVPEDDPDRLRAAITNVFDQAANLGSTALTRAEFDAGLQRLIGWSDPTREIDRLYRDGTLREVGPNLVQLGRYYDAERTIAAGVTRLMRTPQMQRPVDLDVSDLNGLQSSAVLRVFDVRVSIITGGPGTGKTRSVKRIINAWDGDVLLMGPTGTSALHAAESAGIPAVTVHSALRGRRDAYGRWSFGHNASNPLPGKRLLVVADESSMVDAEMAAAFFSAIPHDGTVVLLGDVDQLPSVGPGAVLHDLITQGVPTTRFTATYRFGNEIAAFADAVKRSESHALEAYEYAEHGRIRFVPQAAAAATVNEVGRLLNAGARLEDIAVLAPIYRGSNGVHELNAAVKRLVNPFACQPQENGALPGIPIVRHWEKAKNSSQARKEPTIPAEARFIAPGDRVITREPDDPKAIINGHAGTVLSCGYSSERVPFVEVLGDDGRLSMFHGVEADKLDLCYAMTIHRMQGKQRKHIVLAASGREGLVFSHEAFLTGITRPEETLTIVGPKDRLQAVISREHQEPRVTALQLHLRNSLTLSPRGIAL